MLRELIDISLLEDYVEGLSRAGSLRIATYDAFGRLICSSSASATPLHGAGAVSAAAAAPRELPAQPVLRQVLPADDPPAQLAFVEHGGALYALAPIFLDETKVGYIGVADEPTTPTEGRVGAAGDGAETPQLHSTTAVAARPDLSRAGLSHAVVAARWASRILSAWCRREARMQRAGEELALVGDIAELLTGEQDLQTILDHIVADTVRVMQCKAASLRLYNARTDELEMRAIFGLSDEYLAKGRIIRAENPIEDEALLGHVVAVDDMSTDPRTQYPEQAKREGLVSALVAGMMYRGRPIGVLRVYTDRRQRFRSMQRNLLRAVASQAATAIVHAQLVAERLRKAELERQLKLAGQVQARMIRTSPPRHPKLGAAWIFEPSQHVGGDFCDFLTLADGRFAATVADVSGKGVPASLLMASVRGALRASGEFAASISEILTRLNKHVYRETAPHEFVTMLLCAIDDEARHLTYCSAGHEPLLLLRDGEIRQLDAGGMVLGIDPDEHYEAGTMELQRGDCLLLYTDGVIEAMNFNQELFGRERLLESLKAHRQPDTYQMLKNIVWDIRRFAGLAERSDDLTLVGLNVN